MPETAVGELKERHPQSIGARVVRSLKFLRGVRGWGRVADLIVPLDTGGGFLVENPTGWFAGDLSSFLDRRMYLFGEYEEEAIRAFLSIVPPDRRNVILDIGANAGTHSLAFALHFAAVHAFEPNPMLWGSFERNIRNNRIANVELHKVAAADSDGEMPFYLTAHKNFGLGTLLSTHQYDLPLEEVGRVKVVHAGRYLDAAGVGRVDAVKIDVQGFEREVIRGLAPVLQRERPIVWFEVAAGTGADAGSAAAIKALFPFDGELYRFESRRGVFRSTVRLVPASPGALPAGDYLILPDRLRDSQ
jgi:FkbM family methyltransferase